MKIRYDAVGALGSIWARKVIPKGFGLDINYQLDHLMGAGGAAYFCSGHVVLCYQAALSQMKMAGQSLFPIQDAGKVFTQEAHCYQPSFLEKILRESRFFTKLGKFRGVVRIGPGDD